MYQSNLWPPVPGINIITEINPESLYQIPKSQMLVFPFSIESPYYPVVVSATHTSFYDNQQGSILAWASDAPGGRSVTGDFNSNLANVNLPGEGYNWLFYRLDKTPHNTTRDIDMTHWLYPDKQYFMCFKNLENKTNGLFCRIVQQQL